jgi:1,4-alpha-glucan branching enzyme
LVPVYRKEGREDGKIAQRTGYDQENKNYLKKDDEEEEYLKSKKVCKVTFRLPKIAVTDAKNAYVVGDFNDWNMYASPMKKLKSGDYTITVELEPGREYQFRYLIDETKWENDWFADKYVKSPYGDSDNSVVIV